MYTVYYQYKAGGMFYEQSQGERVDQEIATIPVGQAEFIAAIVKDDKGKVVYRAKKTSVKS